jgi:hypothetical protein
MSGYLGRLDAELQSRGFSGGLRGRIAAEFADHMECDPMADLGDPELIAGEFADGYGTSLARRTACRAFLLVGGAMALLIAMFFDGGRLAGWGGYEVYRASSPSLIFRASVALMALAAQIAIAASLLALARAWRLRRVPVISTAEARVLNRRAAVALIAGATAMLMVAVSLVWQIDWSYFRKWGMNWFGWPYGPSGQWYVLGVALAAALAQLAALPAVLYAARRRPLLDGGCGLLADDLALGAAVSGSNRSSDLIAVSSAVVLALATTAVGMVNSGLARAGGRGLVEAAALLVCYFGLGGYLGLRRGYPWSRPARPDGQGSDVEALGTLNTDGADADPELGGPGEAVAD